ncbi:MAG: hypothetical protein A2W47_05610 [Gammaproteobacteria bacterium RIFCSPHIGHO2_12_38_15]|nr:MAG: hypothetical protein A2W47_05610 [Gammaproteobacteria bacterium RIFCSPHIGHO2_12_38_15]
MFLPLPSLAASEARFRLGLTSLSGLRPDRLSLREKHTPRFKKKRDLSRVFRGNPNSSSYLIVDWIASKMREPSCFFSKS